MTTCAFVVFRDDVVDLERQPVVLLRNLTILAAIVRAPPYQFLQPALHACLMRPPLLFPIFRTIAA